MMLMLMLMCSTNVLLCGSRRFYSLLFSLSSLLIFLVLILTNDEDCHSQTNGRGRIILRAT